MAGVGDQSETALCIYAAGYRSVLKGSEIETVQQLLGHAELFGSPVTIINRGMTKRSGTLTQSFMHFIFELC